MKMPGGHPAVAEGNFFKAGDLEALVVLDGANKLRGFQQGFVGAGVKPGVATPEDFDVKITCFHVSAVDAGDFQLTAVGRFDLFGEFDNALVIEIESGDKTLGAGHGGGEEEFRSFGGRSFSKRNERRGVSGVGVSAREERER